MTIDERLERLTGSVEQLSAAQQKTETALRRAITLSVREARAERKRRAMAVAQIDDQITKLAAAQLITEEKLQRFLEGLRGKNGHA
jgi:hypothetical protein